MLPALLLCVLVFQWSTEVSGSDPEFLEHIKRVRSFPCKHPRMTAVKTITLVDAGVSKHYIPESTVLHRCDSGSGCCSNSKLSCGPLDADIVDLKFLVKDMSNIKNSGYETIRASNHTRCGCMNINDNPRRSMTGGSSKCDRLSLLQTLVIFSVILWKFTL